MKEKEAGVDNPEVADCLHHIAETLRFDARYDEAEPLYQRSLAIRQKLLGPNHPDVAKSLEAYALLLALTYREAEAEHMKTCARSIKMAKVAP